MFLKNTLIKILLAFLCIIFWVLVFVHNIVPGGKFATSTDFSGTNPVRSHLIDTINKIFKFELFKNVASNGANPWLPGLRPIERVVNRNIIISDPLYLDIKLPTRFDQLKVRLDYDNQSGGDFRVGIFTNKDKWQILFAKQQDGEYVFDLRGLSLEKNIIPLVFGAPKATVDKPVIIKKMEVTASKPELTWQRFKELARNPKVLLLVAISLTIASAILFFIFLPITASTFAVILAVGNFFDVALLELWRPGFVANFVDSRIFILLFLVVVGWYWLAHKNKKIDFL